MARDFSYEIRSFGSLADYPDRGMSLKEHQSPDMVNLMITRDRRLKKREGFRTVCRFQAKIRGIWSGILGTQRHWFVVESVRVRHSLSGFRDMEQVGTLPGNDRVQIIKFNDRLYFLGGSGIRVFDPEEGFSNLKPYRPLIMIATTPDGVGTPLEEVNLLGGGVRQSFSPDGKSARYQLALTGLTGVDYVSYNGKTLEKSAYSADLAAGVVSFREVPDEGDPDCLEIGYSKGGDERRARIEHCRWGMLYGGDNDLCVFLWGNADEPAMRFHSGLADGKPSFEYFPENNYTLVGDGAPITDILRHYDRQLIFTAESAYFSYPQTTADELGRNRISYPVTVLSGAAGSVAPGSATLVDNDPVTVSYGGLCRWKSTALRDEKNARIFSGRIERGLNQGDPSKIRLYCRPSDGNLYIVTDSYDVYVYSPSTDCFWLYRGLSPYCFFEEGVNRDLYFGTEDGRLCLMGGSDDDGEAIEVRWRSAELDLGDSVHSKTLFKVGIEMTPCEADSLTLRWNADVESKNFPNGRTREYSAQQPLFGFWDWDFARLSFNGAYTSRTLSRRVEARRFGKISFTLTSRSTGELEIGKIKMIGIINDKIL